MAAALADGNGLVTTAELSHRGCDPRRLAAIVRSGELVGVRRGVYTSGELWAGLDVYRGRPLLRIRAAGRTLETSHVFSHDSAALLQDLPVLDSRSAPVHVTRPGVRGTRTRYGIHHHGAPYAAHDVVVVDGLTALGLARTVADVARSGGYLAGLVVADGALQRGVSKEAMRKAAVRMRSWPGITTVRRVIAEADPGAESAAETLGRDLVTELGLGRPRTQFPVRVGGGVRWVDMIIGRHAFEVDGRAKVIPVAQGGVATQPPAEVVWEEKRREREVTSLGLGMSRIFFEDFWGGRRKVALERLAAEVDSTRHRFGSELPAEMLEFAARVGHRHPASRT